MKRIYATLALLGALITGTYAQSIDLHSVIGLPLDGDYITKGSVLDTSKVIFGTFYNGPDDIFEGDVLWTMTSFSNPASDSTTYVDGVIFGGDIAVADSGFIYVFPNSNEFGQGHTAPFTLSADSIHSLYDWDAWSTDGTIVQVKPPYECGKDYGIWFRSIMIGDEDFNPIADDPTPDDNRAVQRIVWDCGTGVENMFPKKDKVEIIAYPNPATDVLNFDYTFEQASHASALVRDLTGRILTAKNFGRVLPGTQTYSIDVSHLPAGNYLIEFDSDYQRGFSKFTIK